MLRRKLMAAALIGLFATPTFAELKGVPADAPVFTREEMALIDRNKTLSEAAKADPWTVRKLLDAVKQSQKDKGAPTFPPGGEGSDLNLEQTPRASPEAAHDLFQLLKQAGEKSDKPK